MIKIRRKWLSILLTLAMLSTLLLPLAGPAFASTSYSALTAPEIVVPSDGVALGQILITIDTLSADTHKAVFTLPTDVTVVGTPAYSVSADQSSPAITVTPVPSGYAGNEFRLDVVSAAVYTDVKITLAITANVRNISGDITCNITKISGQLTSGSVVVGKAVSEGTVTLSCPDVKSLTSVGGTVYVDLKESVKNSIYRGSPGSGHLKLTLPPGFEWGSSVTVRDLRSGGSWTTGTSATGQAVTAERTSDTRKLSVNADVETVAAGVYRVEGTVTVNESTAKFGDVEVSVTTDKGVNYTPSSIKVASYADYGVSVKEKTSKDIIAGKKEQLCGEFTIEEAVKSSIVANRTITLTLPAGVKWIFSGDTPTNITKVNDKVGMTLSGPTRVDDQTIKYTTGSATSDATTMRFKDIKVNVAVDATGDVNVTVGGSAGVSGTVKIATIKSAVTATAASTPDVIIGEQGQAVGDLTITEGIAEAMKSTVDSAAGYVYVATPSGVRFAATPTVAVYEGDLQIDSTSTKLQDSDSVLSIKIKSASSKVSSIKVSNIKLTLDRTVPVGSLALKIKGNAINETSTYFPSSETAARVQVANVVTPAPTETKGTAVFKIGDAKYTVNGVEQTMDAAAYIENGRTFVPLRYVAYAAGVSAENILYANGKVTIIKGDKVIQLTIGSTTMVINGIAITMDVPATVKSGRTMLPVRWVAQALGCAVEYNETDQTVTVN